MMSVCGSHPQVAPNLVWSSRLPKKGPIVSS
jgi:hypothetical protein